MGSLRRPVGPLPSSIYWRRRAVVLSLVALLALLVIWALASGSGGGGTETTGDGGNAEEPAESITPGPTPSESFIDTRPSGRESSEPTDDTGQEGDDEGGGTTGDADGDAEGGAGGEDGGTSEGQSDGQSGGAASGGSSGGQQDPSGLPACEPADVTVTFTSARNEYGLDEEPELVVTAENVSGVSCVVDFGHDALSVAVTDPDAEPVWSSDDCPTGAASAPTAVWAGDSASHTLEWDRRHSTGDCDGPPGREAETGTSYLAEATLAGFSSLPPTSFRLDDD
ncbi:hypothetical protein ACTWP5_03120 [Streptomyces sp. 4N509B]|uniref:hypothetical protein n=1 Tax=Streptomyces sp. 4N509B TaxID=3457413 RepID=UPI003FD00531